MKKLIIALFILLALNIDSNSQKKLQFSTQNLAGLLEGDNGSAFQIQSINGFKLDKWFAGIGVGLDYYYVRSVPVFLSINRNLNTHSRTPFIFLDGGINYAWIEEERDQWSDFVDSKFSPSLYWSGGLGYKIGLRKADAIIFNIGYSYKHLKEVQQKSVFCINPPCAPQFETFNYYLRRVSLRVGWQL